MSETLDNFLGGRIKLVQPSDGYRAGIDPIFLAACLHPKPHEKILDVGCGVGVASISLAIRCPLSKIIGLEVQPDLVQLALKNIQANQVEDRVEIINGDLLSPPTLFKPNSFDQLMTNPPYYQYNRTLLSPIPGKAQANTETVDLGKWIKACLKFLKPKGVFTMIHRAERLSEILHHLGNRVGDLVIYPLWPGPNKNARRILIQGRKNLRGELRLVQGITLHGGAEKYTPEAEAVLRHAQTIVL
ncbi:MAG: methyltransferase domain-containing protein [Proteobacteria bacterium]|nr:methyltransferase domain-containing protein [Pseudomonadota bacterium]